MKRIPRLDDDLSFPPPYSEQAKYLALANKFLSLNGSRVVQIDSAKHFQRAKKTAKRAARKAGT